MAKWQQSIAKYRLRLCVTARLGIARREGSQELSLRMDMEQRPVDGKVTKK